MTTLQLYYPKGDILIERDVTPYTTAEEIKKEWAHKYGKLLDQCKITVIKTGLKSQKRKVIFILTGEIFDTMRDAAKETGFPPSTISCHCNRALGRGSEDRYKFKFQ